MWKKIMDESPAPQSLSDLSDLSHLKLLCSFTESPRADFVLAFLELGEEHRSP
jgi:hypothetical protein